LLCTALLTRPRAYSNKPKALSFLGCWDRTFSFLGGILLAPAQRLGLAPQITASEDTSSLALQITRKDNHIRLLGWSPVLKLLAGRSLAGVKQNICPKGVGGILMFQPKRASKQKRRACAIPLMGAAGLSLSVATGASAATVGPAAHEIPLYEEEVSDVSLATFYVAWRHSMSSTRKASVQAGPTYSLSDAAATAAATTP